MHFSFLSHPSAVPLAKLWSGSKLFLVPVKGFAQSFCENLDIDEQLRLLSSKGQMLFLSPRDDEFHGPVPDLHYCLGRITVGKTVSERVIQVPCDRLPIIRKLVISEEEVTTTFSSEAQPAQGLACRGDKQDGSVVPACGFRHNELQVMQDELAKTSKGLRDCFERHGHGQSLGVSCLPIDKPSWLNGLELSRTRKLML